MHETRAPKLRCRWQALPNHFDLSEYNEAWAVVLATSRSRMGEKAACNIFLARQSETRVCRKDRRRARANEEIAMSR